MLTIQDHLKNLLAAIGFGFISGAVAAQTDGLPPEHIPAGNSARFFAACSKVATVPTGTGAAGTVPLKPSVDDRRASRKAIREAKVGNKPLD